MPQEAGMVDVPQPNLIGTNLIDTIVQNQKVILRALHDTSMPDWLQLELTMAQLKGLFALRQLGPVSVGGLAEALNVGLPATSILLEKLVQLNLAGRREDAADRRRTLVYLTSQGEQYVTRLRQGSKDRFREWLDQLDGDTLRDLARGLHALALIAAPHQTIHEPALEPDFGSETDLRSQSETVSPGVPA